MRYGAGAYDLRGAGIGSVFTNVFRGVVPLFRSLIRTGAKVSRGKVARKALSAAKKSGVKAGIRIIGDALKGENVVQSAKKRSKQAAQEMSSAIAKSISTAVEVPAKKKPGRKKTVVATPAAVVARRAVAKRGEEEEEEEEEEGRGAEETFSQPNKLERRRRRQRGESFLQVLQACFRRSQNLRETFHP
jgi:tetrahydromethanopterin S-methyltransferase subunit A